MDMTASAPLDPDVTDAAATDGVVGAQFVRVPSDGRAIDKRVTGRQVALVPGALVPVLQLDIPKGIRGQAREQVARRLLQDRLGLGAQDVQMHPLAATGDKLDSWTRVMVSDTALLRGWRAAAGTACRALLPDYLALPIAPDLWTLAATNDSVVARLGLEDGFSAPSDMAAVLLETALQGPAPKAVLHLGGPLPTAVAGILGARDIPVVPDAAALAPLGLGDPLVLGHGELGLDLRRDAQASRARMRARILPWRWPLMAAALAAGLWGAALWVETDRLHRQSNTLDAATRALVRDRFVPQGPILDIRLQVARALTPKAQTPEEGAPVAAPRPWDVFADLSTVLMEQGAAPVELRYTPADGLRLEAQVADFAAVERLEAALIAAGLTVQEAAQSRVVAGQSGVRASLRLGVTNGGAGDD